MFSKSEVINGDCMDYLKDYPDDYFSLSLVDPPYGLKASDLVPGSDISSTGVARKQKKQRIIETIANIKPSLEYWDELFRVSNDVIAWGWNHYGINKGPGRIIWVKNNPVLSGAEIAFNSVQNGVYVFEYTWSGFCRSGETEPRIHPTQKPIALYKWLLKNYAKEGDSILDTHGGSFSSRIACHDMGFDFTGYEIDKDYFYAGEKRFQNHIKQQSLFNPKEMYQ